jgi:Adenine-specific methyltransferase EcoRI
VTNGRNKSANEGLGAAKSAKKDEFYTQYVDIQKEVEAYLEYDADTFRNKVVYCNCDDPFESNFFKYFAANFNRLGLKKLIATSYDGSPIAGEQLRFDDGGTPQEGRPQTEALLIEIEEVIDLNDDGATDIEDVRIFLEQNPHKRAPLKGGGDFRSPECVELLKQADIIVTNPPFSLFRDYVAQLVEHKKKFLIIGNFNAVTYKEIFPHIMANKMWLGETIHSGDREFRVPESYPLEAAGFRVDSNGNRYIRVKGVRWYTNLDHGRRHEPLSLMTMADNVRFNPNLEDESAYETYDNYDAIEVGSYKAIPNDHDGIMGVPITFLDKHNPDQFEIVGTTESNDRDNPYRTRWYSSPECRAAYQDRFGRPGVYDLNASGVVNGIKKFKRVLIRRRGGSGGQEVTSEN